MGRSRRGHLTRLACPYGMAPEPGVITSRSPKPSAPELVPDRPPGPGVSSSALSGSTDRIRSKMCSRDHRGRAVRAGPG